MEDTTLDPIVPNKPKKEKKGNEMLIITIGIAIQLGAFLFFFFYLKLF